MRTASFYSSTGSVPALLVFLSPIPDWLDAGQSGILVVSTAVVSNGVVSIVVVSIAVVRGWATWSSVGRTHTGYILNPVRSMRAYAVPGQWITILIKPSSFHDPEEVNNSMLYTQVSGRPGLFLTIVYYPFRIYTLPLTTLELKDSRLKYLMVKQVPVCISV
jgi:hypothetical protein